MDKCKPLVPGPASGAMSEPDARIYLEHTVDTDVVGRCRLTL